jgi:hypothetical protein
MLDFIVWLLRWSGIIILVLMAVVILSYTIGKSVRTGILQADLKHLRYLTRKSLKHKEQKAHDKT